MAYKPTAGDRNEAYGGYELTGFETCNACPKPKDCERAGKCLLNDAFSPKETMKRVQSGKGFK